MAIRKKEFFAHLVFLLAANAAFSVAAFLLYLAASSAIPDFDQAVSAEFLYPFFFLGLGLLNVFLLFSKKDKPGSYREFCSIAFFRAYDLEELKGLIRRIKRSPRFHWARYAFFSGIFLSIGVGAMFFDPAFGGMVTAFFIVITIYMWLNRAKLVKVATSFFIGSSMIGIGKGEDALMVAEGSLRLSPRNVGGHWLKGNALMAMERYHDAIEAYETAVVLQPKSRALLMPFIALAHHNLNMPNKAKNAYTEALRLDPACMEAHYGMAAVLASEGDVKSAMGHLDRALALGYGHREHVENDPDFEGLREDEQFKAILERHFKRKKHPASNAEAASQ